MGTFSIILGIVALAGFVGVSIPIANYLAGQWVGLLEMFPDKYAIPASQISLLIIGCFAVIGLLFCVGLVTAGLGYNKAKRAEQKLRRLRKAR